MLKADFHSFSPIHFSQLSSEEKILGVYLDGIKLEFSVYPLLLLSLLHFHPPTPLPNLPLPFSMTGKPAGLEGRHLSSHF